jgi:pantoate--beta-alanine ligase
MVIFKNVHDIAHYLDNLRCEGARIGFVPTMGALHRGHISLLERCKADGLISVCSIFVNPTQFNDPSDFDKYPISTDADMAMLIETGCDILLLPSVAEVYPDGSGAMQSFDFGYLDTVFEGAQRPGHFRGVGQVVNRLLQVVQPHKLYMGQKDYQQCMVISKLLQMTGSTIEMVICPTIREADGLAMSSRNRRLSEPQRAIAGIIYQCLVSIQAKNGDCSFARVRKECEDLMTAKGLAPEYVNLATAADLSLLQDYLPGTPMVALIAARVGDVRLIDNILL